MAENRIDIEIVATDRASSVISSIQNGIGGSLSTISNAYSSFYNGLRNYNNAMSDFNRFAYNTFRSAVGYVVDFTSESIKAFMDLEQQHAKTIGAMAADYDKTAASQQKFLQNADALKSQAYELAYNGPFGTGSLFDITDISSVQTSLIKGGKSADDILGSNAVAEIMMFAGGNDIDLNTASEFAVQLGTQFGIEMTEWGKMLDEVTRAADISIVDVEDIIHSMSYAGNLASALDLSLDGVLAMISVMGNSGLIGQKAGSGTQAILSRLLTAAGNGDLTDAELLFTPTDRAAEAYNKFVASLTTSNDIDTTGMSQEEIEALIPELSLVGMGNIIEALYESFNSLDDVEMGWMAKKLFGLFQMKAALALINGEESDLSYNQAQEEIASAENVNAYKYEVQMDTSWGKAGAADNAFDAAKAQFGESLAPITEGVMTEFLTWVQNKGNYEINWDSLRGYVQEAADLVTVNFGESLGNAVSDVGNALIDAGMIAEAVSPVLPSIGDAFIKFFTGHPIEAVESLFGSLDEIDANIEGLPENLQELAKGVRNAVYAFVILAGLNLVATVVKILAGIISPIATFIGWLGGKIMPSAKTTVASASTTVTTPNVIAQISNFLAQTPLMNVNAGTVIINGGVPGTGSGSGAGGGNPLLGSGGSGIIPMMEQLALNGTTQLLLAGGGGLALGSGLQYLNQLLLAGGSGTMTSLLTPTVLNMPAVAGGGGQLLLPAASGAGGSAGSTLVGTILPALAKSLGFIGTFLSVAEYTMPRAGINNSPTDMMAAYQEAYNAGMRGDDIETHMRGNDNYPGMLEGGAMPDGTWFHPRDMIKFLQGSSSFMNSSDGLQMFWDAIASQKASGGEITEKFLNDFMDANGLDYGFGQQILEQMLNNMFNGTYTTPDKYKGEYANESVNDFINAYYNDRVDFSSLGTQAQILEAMNGKLDNLTYVNGSANVYSDGMGKYYQLQADGALQDVSTEMAIALGELSAATSALSTLLPESLSTAISDAIKDNIIDRNEESQIYGAAMAAGYGPISMDSISKIAGVDLVSMLEANTGMVTDAVSTAFDDTWAQMMAELNGEEYSAEWETELLASLAGSQVMYDEIVGALTNFNGSEIIGAIEGLELDPELVTELENYMTNQINNAVTVNVNTTVTRDGTTTNSVTQNALSTPFMFDAYASFASRYGR